MIRPELAPERSEPALTPHVAPDDRRVAIRKAFFLEAYRHLHEDRAAEPATASTMACLTARGFNVQQLAQLPVGLMASRTRMRTALARAGFTPEEITKSNLLADPRLPGRLVGPIGDAQGQIVSFWAWDPTGQRPRCLYLRRDWKRQVGLYGLDVALPAIAGGAEGLVIVEEILDALLLHSRGVLCAAAIGGPAREMTPDRWQRLAAMGVQSAALVSGDARFPDQGTIAAIDSASRAESTPVVYVLPIDGRVSDVVRWRAAAPFPELLPRVHGYRYRALTLLARHAQEGAWTDAARQAALEEAMRFYAAAHRRNIPQLDTFFVPPICHELGLGWDACQVLCECASSDDVLQQEPMVVEPPAEEVAGAQRQSIRQPDTGACSIHGCDPMKCFCWD